MANLGVVHKDRRIIGVTGTAVITIKDCKASMLVESPTEEPIFNKAIVSEPIIIAQNSRKDFGGFVFALITIAAA